jgi:hypothetical protein
MILRRENNGRRKWHTVRLSLSAKINQQWNNVFLSQRISISQKYSQPNTACVSNFGLINWFGHAPSCPCK